MFYLFISFLPMMVTVDYQRAFNIYAKNSQSDLNSPMSGAVQNHCSQSATQPAATKELLVP